MISVKLEITQLDKTTQCSIYHEINESEETKTRCLQKLRKKLQAVQDLNSCLDEIFLLKFLRVTKYDTEKAFARVIRFYRQRKTYPLVYDTFYPSSIVDAVKTRNLWVLPYRAKDNSAIFVYQRKMCDSSVPYEEIIRMVDLAIDTLLLNQLTQMCGVTFIADLKVSAALNEYSPSRLRFIAECIQNSCIARVKAVHVVNIPNVFYLLYSIIYPFLPSKIRQRFILHKKHDSWKALHSHIAPELLPSEYGGMLKKSDMIDTIGLMREKEAYFQNQNQYGFINKNK